jgi:outer membrane receptor protein involved in Fe transport
MQNVVYAGGRNGAYGPDYFQLDLRAGWRRKISTRVLEIFLDVFNVTNRANFDNPTSTNSDRRVPSSFLVLTNLRGGGGFPRQAEMGFRFVF